MKKESTTINISLTRKLEKAVRDRVKSGLYNSASEVMREALRYVIALETVPEAEATPAELKGVRRGAREHEKGQHITLDNLFYDLGRPRRLLRKKGSQKSPPKGR
ncbi:MAG: hypothetical protein COU08_00240 [Candidatus Harrisonbacteria bacterium CG10_big_fil_rev_8_21_14_0_10_42_17]|uniref:Type II toxin-antitoxin system ParD family antitoxin n=1 Tax=Candidatus Harrisonbacteria bacterium CG10_big_fil_rev_8_21_14_0_10_42_17 TaxID=1974584 RepID=A0A2M6WJF1_9BACT|nr:MAG: hypothetical protein COU08_00240 [Candidatus Harrisonbacteria bacterium CG10_big_fil_rev_8_21_14_0_10_42_17]